MRLLIARVTMCGERQETRISPLSFAVIIFLNQPRLQCFCRCHDVCSEQPELVFFRRCTVKESLRFPAWSLDVTGIHQAVNILPTTSQSDIECEVNSGQIATSWRCITT